MEEHFICNSTSCEDVDCSGRFMYNHLSKVDMDKFKEMLVGAVLGNRYKKDDVVVSIDEFAQGIQCVSTPIPVAMGLGIFMYGESDRGFEEILYSMDVGYWTRKRTSGGSVVMVDKELAFMGNVGVQEQLLATTKMGDMILNKMLPEEIEKLKEMQEMQQNSGTLSLDDLRDLMGGVVERMKNSGEEFRF